MTYLGPDADPVAGSLPDGADGQLQPKDDPRPPAPCKGFRDLRLLQIYPGCQCLHQRGVVPTGGRKPMY